MSYNTIKLRTPRPNSRKSSQLNFFRCPVNHVYSHVYIVIRACACFELCSMWFFHCGFFCGAASFIPHAFHVNRRSLENNTHIVADPNQGTHAQCVRLALIILDDPRILSCQPIYSLTKFMTSQNDGSSHVLSQAFYCWFYSTFMNEPKTGPNMSTIIFALIHVHRHSRNFKHLNDFPPVIS